MPRLEPLPLTKRDLALLSRNRCAFPKCTNPIFDVKTNAYVAQLCHIEAAEVGGERYNPAQTDEERRAIGNLLFLCYPHHQATNNESVFTTEKMKEIKRVHEASVPADLVPESIVEAILKSENFKSVVGKLVKDIGSKNSGYSLRIGDAVDAWVPEQGKMHKIPAEQGAEVRLMMNGNQACIEYVFPDGAVAYYEVDEQGNVGHNKFPYPLEEYTLLIPSGMIVSASSRGVGNGCVETHYVLKWGRSLTVTRHPDRRIGLLELNARSTIKHSERLIEVLSA